MDADLNQADDYLAHAEGAIKEARSQISLAASVSVEDLKARQTLAESLGEAHNAISRAQRDLELHRGRERRRADRDSAEAYLESIHVPDSGKPFFEIALLPLPIEDERVPVEQLHGRDFERNLFAWITRFNNQQKTRYGYLMEAPGGMSARKEDEHLRYMTYPDRATEPSQEAFIYPSGAFVFYQPLWYHSDPPAFFLEYAKEKARFTLMFVNELFQELNFVPRAIAIQLAVRNVADFQLMVPGRFSLPVALKPKANVTSFFAPNRPLILSGMVATMLERALPAIDAAVRANYSAEP